MKTAYVRFGLVWLFLVAATLAAWFVGHSPEMLHGGVSAQIIASLLVVAFLKVGFVFAYFMELRLAPRRLAALFAVWGVVLCASLIGLMAPRQTQASAMMDQKTLSQDASGAAHALLKTGERNV